MFYPCSQENGGPEIAPAQMANFAEDGTEQTAARESLQSLIAAQERELSNIARELHDDICQRLAMLALRIEKATKAWAAGQRQVGEQLEQIWRQCNALTCDVQALSHELHPSLLENLGLVTAVRSICRGVSEQRGIEVKFTEKSIPSSLPPDVSLSLFRVVQEALYNAVRHSGEKHFEVHLQAGTNEIELEVRDRGTGFDPASMKPGKGLGLVSMTERIHLLDGRITIDSKPNLGTTIRASVPLAASSKDRTNGVN
jgi:signal transduction histidine kinase